MFFNTPKSLKIYIKINNMYSMLQRLFNLKNSAKNRNQPGIE